MNIPKVLVSSLKVDSEVHLLINIYICYKIVLILCSYTSVTREEMDKWSCRNF